MSPLGEPLLTARTVGTLVGVSAETVLRWTRRGELPAVRLPGGAIRFHGDALEAWLATRQTTRSTTNGGPASNGTSAKERDDGAQAGP